MKLNGAVPIVPYRNPRAAIQWLAKAFDATPTLVVPPEEDQPLIHAEVAIGTGVVMVDDAERTDSPFALPGPVVVYVVVDDPMPCTPELLMPARRSSCRPPIRTTDHANSPPATCTAMCGASGRTGRAWAIDASLASTSSM